jgi:hypothetical protein
MASSSAASLEISKQVEGNAAEFRPFNRIKELEVVVQENELFYIKIYLLVGMIQCKNQYKTYEGEYITVYLKLHKIN